MFFILFVYSKRGTHPTATRRTDMSDSSESGLGKCPTCGKSVSVTALSCPNCGETSFIEPRGQLIERIACRFCGGNGKAGRAAASDYCWSCNGSGQVARYRAIDRRTGTVLKHQITEHPATDTPIRRGREGPVPEPPRQTGCMLILGLLAVLAAICVVLITVL